MSWVLMLAVAVLVVVVLAAIAIKMVGGGGRIGYPYVQVKALFTPAERSFLGALDTAVGPQRRVFGKVRIADIAGIKPGLGKSARQAALNRVIAKHFDFVVCRASDLAVLCVVELNDKSHASKSAQARDEVKRRVCEAVHIPLIEVAAKRAYAVEELRMQLATAMPADFASTPVAPLPQGQSSGQTV
ncbi:MAG: DUF2726 domain-containing protein [Comamonas sp.]